jgi:hypothetical protein
MRTAIGGTFVRPAFVLCISLITTSAWSQSAPQSAQQTLDRIDAFNATKVLEMQFDDPDRTSDFIDLGITGTSFTDCKLTALDGLYCLDGKVIRHWPDIDAPGTSINEFSCADSALNLVTNKPDTCSAMTVALSGAIYLGGRKSGSYSLLKVVAKNGTCPTGFTTSFASNRYCSRELYTGRSAILDLDPLDDVGATFKPCPTCPEQRGVLALEDRNAVVFFRDPKPTATTQPTLIATVQNWGLIGSESLLSAAVFEVANGNATDSYVVTTTSNGRILAKQTNAAGSAFQVFDIPSERQSTATQCNFDTQHYGVRASTKSGRVYVTDRNFCEVLALKPSGQPSTGFTALVNDTEGTSDLTLATGTTAPGGATLAPGIVVDLTECAGSCTYLKNGQGTPAASFVGVKLASGSESDATVFLIEGIPDCRQVLDPDFPPGLVQTCADANAVVTLPGAPNHPAAQLLDLTKLFPFEILSLFDSSGVPPEGLPPLLVSRQYRGQRQNHFLFNAFLYLTEPGVHFQDNFTAEYDVPILEGEGSLGCVPDPNNLIAWDIITNVSELFLAADGDGDNLPSYVDTLTNTGCTNPTKTFQTRISAVPYNLEVNPDTYGPIFGTTLTDVTEGNDAVFARLVQSLYDDLEFVRRELACKLVDAQSGQPPIASNVCNTLASKWANGKIKLDKCINAGFQPKQSTADENCQSFVTQLTNYRSSIPATTPTRDIANRVGELKMRVDVIRHVFDTRLLPSLTTDGFCRETDPSPTTCPDPWL